MKYPETRRVDQVDEYLRREGARSVSLARGRRPRVARSRRVGEERERSCPRVSWTPFRNGQQSKSGSPSCGTTSATRRPSQKGGKYFYSKNDGLQNQAVLYVADSYKAEGRVLIDPNKWSKDGTVALSSLQRQRRRPLLAYARSEAGSDWQQIYVLDVETGKELDEPLEVGRASATSIGTKTAAASTTPAIPSRRRASSIRPPRSTR